MKKSSTDQCLQPAIFSAFLRKCTFAFRCTDVSGLIYKDPRVTTVSEAGNGGAPERKGAPSYQMTLELFEFGRFHGAYSTELACTEEHSLPGHRGCCRRCLGSASWAPPGGL